MAGDSQKPWWIGELVTRAEHEARSKLERAVPREWRGPSIERASAVELDMVAQVYAKWYERGEWYAEGFYARVCGWANGQYLGVILSDEPGICAVGQIVAFKPEHITELVSWAEWNGEIDGGAFLACFRCGESFARPPHLRPGHAPAICSKCDPLPK